MLILNLIPTPNVNTNPLPSHQGGITPSINLVELEEEPSKRVIVVVITPLIIDYVPKEPVRSPLVIQGLAPFQYESNHKVSWIFEAQIVGAEKEEVVMIWFGGSYLEDRKTEMLLKKKGN